ncbi:hypothetical protein BV25DRAFT_1840207 [Artomyces pyxidatus]|uniref:Uncharacterized protein n=1 Tax=Artomyces pyxidatus TaxID=48021 RepID=A0ACB8STJ2_9AGAM|nr:hypothetical protein BV25DRAFT_1840207 [Artomyces pyxidatus]
MARNRSSGRRGNGRRPEPVVRASQSRLESFGFTVRKQDPQVDQRIEDTATRMYYISKVPENLLWEHGSLVSSLSEGPVTLLIVGELRQTHMTNPDGTPVARVTVTLQPVDSFAVPAAHALSIRYSQTLPDYTSGLSPVELTIGTWSMADACEKSGSQVIPFRAVYDARKIQSMDHTQMVRMRGTDLEPGDLVLAEVMVSQSVLATDAIGRPENWIAVFDLTCVQLLMRGLGAQPDGSR